MPDYTKLTVWNKAHELALDVYRLSVELPSLERYGLQSQMRRAAVSIAANIAEGSGRPSDRDFARFLSTAIGSASELEYEIALARDLGYLRGQELEAVLGRVVEVRKMLLSLRDYLVRSDSRLATGDS